MSTKTRHAPAPCAGQCGKLVRSRNTKVKDYPGTVLDSGRGYCWTCKQAYKPKSPEDRPTHCFECKRPMRKWNETLEDHPDTVRASIFGTCDGCYRKELKQKREPFGITVDDNEGISANFNLEQAQRDLEAWLEERRSRIRDRRHYPIADVVVEYNPHNAVAVITRNGNPIGAAYGLSNGFELASRLIEDATL